MVKPLIGVTPTLKMPEGILGVRDQYLRSVTLAGGVPVLLPLHAPQSDLAAIFSRLDGLLVTGGADVDPARYGEKRLPECGSLLPERDEMELFLIGLADRADLPVFGICRGMQVMNVARGGTLIQDIPSALGIALEKHRQTVPYEVMTHDVAIEPETRLARILKGRSACPVNTMHHQCVKTLGDGLVVNARSTADDIIEAIDDPGKRFFFGVQWHPEMLAEAHEEALALFEAFVLAAAEKL